MSQQDFGIYEIVRAIRQDLDKIRDDESLQKDATLDLGGLDLELNAVVSKAAEGGIRFWLVEAGGRAGKESGTKITLHFNAFETPKRKPASKARPKQRRARVRMR